MKFTSEDLLKAMGLKVGDNVQFLGVNNVFIVCDNNKEEFPSKFCLYCESKDFTIPITNLLDFNWSIIQPKPTLTEDERQAAQQKAQESREAKKAYAEANLKLSYFDESFWTAKATELGLRLPQQYDTGAKGMRKVAKKLGVDIKEFLETTGCSNLLELVQLNPTWNSRALASLILEYHLESVK